MRTFCAVVMAAAGGIAGVASGQQSFMSAHDLGFAEPQTGTAINAGQVLTGLAQRYVISAFDGYYADGRTMVQPAALGGGPAAELPLPAGVLRAVVVGTSDDGNKVLSAVSYSNGTVRACLWDDWAQTLWTVGSNSSQRPVALSADGTRMLLRIGLGPGEQSRVVSASQSQLLTDPAENPPLPVHAQVLSPDGQSAAGTYNFTAVFQWNSADGTTLSQPPYPGDWEPVAVSDNGRYVFVATQTDEEEGGRFDCATYVDGAWQLIPGFNPRCQRRDGAQISGVSWQDGRPKLWSPTTGEEDVHELLQARGLNLNGWVLKVVEYISPDGRKLVGRGVPPAGGDWRWWVATIEPYAAADIGRSGGFGGSDGRLDTNDFIVFIDRFFAQDGRADMGKAGGGRGADGLLDNNDFIAFINLFFSGQP